MRGAKTPSRAVLALRHFAEQSAERGRHDPGHPAHGKPASTINPTAQARSGCEMHRQMTKYIWRCLPGSFIIRRNLASWHSAVLSCDRKAMLESFGLCKLPVLSA
jgi:hypothetical protein